MTSTHGLAQAAHRGPITLGFVLAGVLLALRKLTRALRNRRDAALLARFDERMLADIGLTRSDLRDAYAEPLWRDPTDILAQRADERRKHRPAEALGFHARLAAPPLAPGNGFCMPRTDRPARYAL